MITPTFFLYTRVTHIIKQVKAASSTLPWSDGPLRYVQDVNSKPKEGIKEVRSYGLSERQS